MMYESQAGAYGYIKMLFHDRAITGHHAAKLG